MAVDPDKLVVRSSTTIEFARYVAGVLGTYTAAVPRGSVTLTDQRGTVTYSDFSSALGDIATQTADGDRTISLSFTAYLIPSSAVFADMYDAYDDNTSVAFRIKAKERVGTTSFDKAFKGFFSVFNVTYSQDGAAEVAITFVGSARIAVV